MFKMFLLHCRNVLKTGKHWGVGGNVAAAVVSGNVFPCFARAQSS